MLTSQGFIWIAILIGVFIILIFRIGRFSGIKTNTRLYLTKKADGSADERKPAVRSVDRISPEAAESMSFSGGETGRTKSLNVMFVFDGVTYDAYEVLGVPAGANRRMVDEAYHALLAQASSSASNRDLIEAAYKALIA